MSPLTSPVSGTIRTEVNFWPSYVDILTIVLMVLVLQTFLQTFISKEYLEIARLKQAQSDLLKTLETEFEQETKAGQIAFMTRPNILQILFSENILFETGKYRLEETGIGVLGRCARVLRQADSSLYAQIQVEGHTDNVPLTSTVYPHDNWELSTARALTVVKEMVANGIDGRKLSANGYAEFSPAADNLTLAGRQKNRRIELRVFFSTPTRNPAPATAVAP